VIVLSLPYFDTCTAPPIERRENPSWRPGQRQASNTAAIFGGDPILIPEVCDGAEKGLIIDTSSIELVFVMKWSTFAC
jgi:hypothetical protein